MTNARSEAYSLWAGLDAEYKRYQTAVSYIPIDQLKLQEDLRKYLCIRHAGFLEQVTHTILCGYLDFKSSGPVFEFASSFFQRAPNLRVAPFVDLVGRFGISKKQRFEGFLTEPRRTALTDLLEVRNDAAHGRVAGGRKLDPARYHLVCEEVYEWLVQEFLGDSVVEMSDGGHPESVTNVPS